MKLIINFVVFIFSIGLLQAQTIYSNQNLVIPDNANIQENSIQDIFSNLDKSKIPTAILKDAAIEFVDLEKYNGVLTDSTYTSPNIVSYLYNTIIMGRMSEKLPSLLITPPIDFQNNWYNSQQIDVIPVAGLFYRYAGDFLVVEFEFSPANPTAVQT